MNQYIISYIGGDHPATPELAKAHLAKFQKWLVSLGDAVVKPMAPYKNIHTIYPDGSVVEGGSSSMSGHTVVQADSIQQAIIYAKSCPFLDINGSLEVAEIVQM